MKNENKHCRESLVLLTNRLEMSPYSTVLWSFFSVWYMNKCFTVAVCRNRSKKRLYLNYCCFSMKSHDRKKWEVLCKRSDKKFKRLIRSLQDLLRAKLWTRDQWVLHVMSRISRCVGLPTPDPLSSTLPSEDDWMPLSWKNFRTWGNFCSWKYSRFRLPSSPDVTYERWLVKGSVHSMWLRS